jgi:hypothetical protein
MPCFKALKLDPVLAYGDWPDLTRQLEQHQLDALAVTSGVPFPAFLELERTTSLRYLPLAARQIRDLRLAIPELSVSSIPAGAYPSLAANLPTVGLYNFAVAGRSRLCRRQCGVCQARRDGAGASGGSLDDPGEFRPQRLPAVS